MSPILKLHLGSAGYCGMLASLNWWKSVQYSRQFGITNESNSPIALAFLISAAVALLLGFLCVWTAIKRLESGRKVRGGRWITHWGVLVYTLPLLGHRASSSSWIEADGVVATGTSGYGYAGSNAIFAFAVAALLLFQILARLIPDDEDLARG